MTLHPKPGEPLSLSRLNHGLPRAQTHPEVVQGTAEFHHEIADTRLPQAKSVFDDATALHTAVDMLNPQPPLVQRLVVQLLLHRQLPAPGFLCRHENLHPRKGEPKKAQVLQQPTPCRQGIRRGVRDGLIVRATAIGIAEKEDRERGIDQQDIFGSVLKVEMD